MSLISVIVPVYNVEKYLNRCVDSILNQTFADFECILVDDGSPDNCGKICDEYAEKDKRIKVIHKENGGLSSARNAGIDVAQGEYLSFIDSDDWIHPQMLEILYNGIIENNVLISVCDYEDVETYKESEQIDGYVFDICDGMDFLIEKSVSAVIACNKLYNNKLFADIRYPVGRLHEDNFVTYKLLYMSGNIAVCDKKLYMYFVNNNSITKGICTLKRTKDIICALEQMDIFIEDHNIYKCKYWSKMQLLKLYNWLYYMEEDIFPDKYKRQISRKMAKIILLYQGKLHIDFKKYPWYYEAAFPRFMKYYWLFDVTKKKIAHDGLLHAMEKGIKRVIKRDF